MISIRNRIFIVPTLIVLCFEILIATALKTTFLRPVFGDFLVVVLIYFLIRIFSQVASLKLGIGVFTFACLIEVGQLIGVLRHLGIQQTTTTDLTVGSTFDWMDIVAYFLGILTALAIDWFWLRTTNGVG